MATRKLRLTFCAAYAVYFDYRRRNDPDFRKSLKRESRRQARIQKEEAEVQGQRQKEEIKTAVREALEEGFPTDLEEREAFFMQQIAQGEQIAAEGECTVAVAISTADHLQVLTQLALLSASTRV
jgi:mitochondrial import receptor subunit TOM20